MNKSKSFILPLILVVLSCGKQKSVDYRPAELKKFIVKVDTSYRRYSKAYTNVLLQDKILLNEIKDVNQFLRDSLQSKVVAWPGIIKNISNEDGYVSFEVHIQKDIQKDSEFPNTDPIVLMSSISKKDEEAINDFLNYKLRDSVKISGPIIPDENLLLLSDGYGFDKHPFSRPVLNILCEDIELIPKKTQ